MTENYSSLDTNRQPVIGVMGSGSEEHTGLAEPLGAWIADRGWHLLCGGGRGVMEAVARGFGSREGRRGVAIGLLPGRVDAGESRTPPGYPNRWIDVPIRTHLPFSGDRGLDPLSRNHINVLSADVVIVLPGGTGTRSEVELAVMYRKPVLAFLGDGGRIEGLEEGRVPVARDLDEVARFVDQAMDSGDR